MKQDFKEDQMSLLEKHILRKISMMILEIVFDYMLV